MSKFDVKSIRVQFPILNRQIDGKPLVYLDNAATTQKPQAVIDSLVDYYSNYNANVHRGAHRLSDEATQKFEQSREVLAKFLNANNSREVIWTSGTTEAINIVANGLSSLLKQGDEVLVTEMEHHANLVTWQQACRFSGATLKVAPINDSGELLLDAIQALINQRTKLVALPHVSNALGTINPVKQICAMAKQYGALVLVDGAQAAAHVEIDVQDIGCDFYAISGHKIYGPTGIGVLWGREPVLAEWPVWKTGGEMIATVTYEGAVWNELPFRFEAGTPNIADAIGFAAAVEWFIHLDLDAVREHEHRLLQSLTQQAKDFPGLKIIGNAQDKICILSFVLDTGHPADIGFLLDKQGIAVRTGHHCAEPLMNRLQVPGTARASLALYNTQEEVETLFSALKKVSGMLA
jgi:cysteine desulfurase/selenocysteine lyase